jgi:DNA-binding IclR family transcriptional regulator
MDSGILQIVSQLIEDLAGETNQSVAIAVWGNLGPPIVRLEEPIEPLHVNLRTGTVMSLAYTATGRLFAAYMPAKVVERLLDDELSRFGRGNGATPHITREALESLLSETRKHGLSRTRGQPIPGIDALCAPVFDAEGHIVLGILAMGLSATFDNNWDGAAAKALKRCAAEVSRRIGRTDGTKK